MRYVEKLDWILDADQGRLKAEEEYQRNIDFVHSLGLKCDCVGWSTLVLGTPEADRVLDAIADFCRREPEAAICRTNITCFPWRRL